MSMYEDDIYDGMCRTCFHEPINSLGRCEKCYHNWLNYIQDKVQKLLEEENIDKASALAEAMVNVLDDLLEDL